ncbi:hypothetical protein Rhopal_004967-T1 [Rhodotorula paludigena]|uniref:Inositol polyphosphate-related phosphatase domain-containing protein n=1 Tax=Rhodotorula paludigena TaxID=86838 RepID=A0AAV5GSD4_9BASI|nr:hypothetical protein Rhopal_004967-T1 [Rhodotorula paludigena]
MAAITTAHGPPPAGPVAPAPAQGADSAGLATLCREGAAVASSSQHPRLPPPIVTDFAYPVEQARVESRADKDAPVCKQDLQPTSPSSPARAPASPQKHAYHYKHPEPAPKRLLKRLGSLIHPHHRDSRKRSSSKSHTSSARSSRPASIVHSTPATGTGTPLVSEPESLLPPRPATASAPPDAIRPCIKVRIVTFNMHDSLPACEGDLSDFLGDINEFPEQHLRRPPKKRGSSHSSMGGRSRASSSKGSILTVPVANDVLPAFPLTEGHPYHVLVVCGQECPTASGMFAGKRRAPDGKGWTSILEDYLCGGCSHDSDSESGMSSGDDDAEREHEASDPASAAAASSAASTDDLASSAHVLTDTASIASHATANGSRGASLSASPHRRARAPYVLVEKERLMGIYCAVFVARCCEDLVEGVSKGRVTAGLMGGRVGNKGGVGISLHFASTRLLFISAHLAAHASGLEFRKANTTKILDELVVDDFWESSGKMGPKPKQLIDRFDSVFFAGDLNFRLNISRLHADWLVRGKDYVTALRFDQLRDVLAESSGVFRGFREGAIDFPPTYKYDIVHPKIHKRRSTLLRGPGSKLTKRNSRADLKSPSLSVTADFDAASNSGSLTDPEVMPASATTTPIPCADDDALSVISSVGTISTLDTTADDDAAGAEFGILGRSELNKADLKSLGLPKPPSKGAETSMDAVRFLTLVKSNSNAAAMEYAKQQKDAKEGTSAGRAGRDRASSTARPRLNGLFAPRPILQASQSAMVVPTTTITAPEANASGNETVPDELGAEDTAQEPVFDSSKKQRVQSWTGMRCSRRRAPSLDSGTDAFNLVFPSSRYR